MKDECVAHARGAMVLHIARVRLPSFILLQGLSWGWVGFPLAFGLGLSIGHLLFGALGLASFEELGLSLGTFRDGNSLH